MDVCKALSLRPDLAKNIGRISVMGGWKAGTQQITRGWLINPDISNRFLALVNRLHVPTVIFSSHSGAGMLNAATAPAYKNEIARTEKAGAEVTRTYFLPVRYVGPICRRSFSGDIPECRGSQILWIQVMPFIGTGRARYASRP